MDKIQRQACIAYLEGMAEEIRGFDASSSDPAEFIAHLKEMANIVFEQTAGEHLYNDPEETAHDKSMSHSKKQLDLRIVYATAMLTKQWHESDKSKNDFIEFAKPIWNDSEIYDAESMTQKVLDDPESPFERIFHWDEFNRNIIYSYIRWFVNDTNNSFIDESNTVGDRPVGEKFILELRPFKVGTHKENA